MIIDIHGHYTTAPPALEVWRNRQVAATQGKGPRPDPADLHISDDELRDSIAANQLRQMDDRGIDLTVFSPAPPSWRTISATRASRPSGPPSATRCATAWRNCSPGGIDLLTRVIPVDKILFASKMIGAVRGIDPETGHAFDDTRRYVEATTNLSAEDRHKVFEGNARRVYPRLDAMLSAAGH